MQKSEIIEEQTKFAGFWEHENPSYVHKSSRIKDRYLFWFRAFAFIMGILSVVVNSYQRGWRFMDSLFMLTHWACMMSNIYFGLLLLHTSLYLPSAKTTDNALGKIIHLLFETVFSLEIPINIGYWFVIVPYAVFLLPGYSQPFSRTLITTSQHLGFLVLIIAECYLNGLRFIRSHAFVPLAVMASYLLLNFTMMKLGRQIYPGITWENVLSLVFLSGGLGLTGLGFWIGMRIK